MAARIAFAYRERFHNDFLIDLIGYRRLGHNEGRRAGLHPAADVPGDRGSSLGAQAVGGRAWYERGLIPAELPEQLVPRADERTADGAGPARSRNALQEPHPAPAAARRGAQGAHRGARWTGCSASTASCCACRKVFTCTHAWRASASAAKQMLRPARLARGRLGRWPRSWPWQPSWRMASPSA